MWPFNMQQGTKVQADMSTTKMSIVQLLIWECELLSATAPSNEGALLGYLVVHVVHSCGSVEGECLRKSFCSLITVSANYKRDCRLYNKVFTLC